MLSYLVKLFKSFKPYEQFEILVEITVLCIILITGVIAKAIWPSAINTISAILLVPFTILIIWIFKFDQMHQN